MKLHCKQLNSCTASFMIRPSLNLIMMYLAICTWVHELDWLCFVLVDDAVIEIFLTFRMVEHLFMLRARMVIFQ